MVFQKVFQKVGLLKKKPLAKVVDLVPFGTLSGPGAPDPDLARFSTQDYCLGRHGNNGVHRSDTPK